MGAGIIGMSCAYYLNHEGHQVLVIDKAQVGKGTSYLNSGYITPSHFTPMVSPGILRTALKFLLDPSGPLYIKPRFDLDFLRWGIHFIGNATPKNVESSIDTLLKMSMMSKRLYKELSQKLKFDFGLSESGLLATYRTSKVEKIESQLAKRGRDLGLEIHQLSKEQVDQMQQAPMDIEGAFWYKDDAHTTPDIFMKGLFEYLNSHGVEFLFNKEITRLEKTKANRVILCDGKQSIEADEIVLASGSWSGKLLKSIGIDLLLQPGKGYSFHINYSGISLPAILTEAKVAVTPMFGKTRIGGTMEISGFDGQINFKRVEAIRIAAQSYYPDVDFSKENCKCVQMGFRPLTPDGVPYIGRIRGCDNLILATGHAMVGWSLGPVTGKLVSQIVSNQKSSIDISRCSPNRKI